MSTTNNGQVAAAFRALLLADTGVSALVGTHVGLHEVPAGTAPPYIIYSCSAASLETLAGNVEGPTTIQAACWAAKAGDAQALALAVIAACEAFDLTSTSVAVTVLLQEPEYDETLALDVVVLTIEWWP